MRKKGKVTLALLAAVACAAVGFAACGGSEDKGGGNTNLPMLVGPVAIALSPTEVETHVDDTFSLTMRYNWGDFDVQSAFANPDAPQPDFNFRWESSVLGAVEFISQDMLDESSDIYWFETGNYVGEVTLTGTSVANPQCTASVTVNILTDGGLGDEYVPCEEEKLELERVDDHYVVTGIGDFELGSVDEGTYGGEPNSLVIIHEPYGIPITEIAAGAFAGNTEITHFESFTVTKIGDNAFENCTSLQAIYLEENIEIGARAFKGCENFKSAIIMSVKSIGEYAFANLTNFNTAMGGEGDIRLRYVENSSIGAHAFEGCTAFTYMDGGSSSLTIGEYAFAGCTGLVSVSNFGCGTLNSYAFDGCVNLGRANSGPSANKVMPYAFNGCTAMGGFSAYREVEIYENAFATCTGLSSVYLEMGATRIGANAFSDCVNLSSVTSYGDIDVIEENAFHGCVKMNRFRVTGSVGEVKAGAFEGVGTEASYNYKYLSYTVSDGTKIFRMDSFKNAAFAELDLSKSETIEPYSFRTCTGEVDIVLPAWMTEIPDKQFAGFMGMRSIAFAPNTTAIGEESFFNCSVKNLVLPATIITIGLNAFAHSEIETLSVETLDTPNSTYEVVDIDKGAFRNCTNLESVSFEGWENSRTKMSLQIRDEAFSGCKGLKTVNLGNIAYFGKNVFQNVRSMTSFIAKPWNSNGATYFKLMAGNDVSYFHVQELSQAEMMAAYINTGNYDKYAWYAM